MKTHYIFFTSPSNLAVCFLNQQFALVLEHMHLAMQSQQTLINIYTIMLVRFAALLCVQVCSLWFDFYELFLRVPFIFVVQAKNMAAQYSM